MSTGEVVEADDACIAERTSAHRYLFSLFRLSLGDFSYNWCMALILSTWSYIHPSFSSTKDRDSRAIIGKSTIDPG